MAFSRRLGVVGIVGASWLVAVACSDDSDKIKVAGEAGEAGQGGETPSGGKANAGGSSNNGAPAAVNQNVSGAPLLVGLTTTCAFALKLYAYAHIRNGYGLIYYKETIKAIAIEKCS